MSALRGDGGQTSALQGPRFWQGLGSRGAWEPASNWGAGLPAVQTRPAEGLPWQGAGVLL